jgi:hypothetical protein
MNRIRPGQGHTDNVTTTSLDVGTPEAINSFANDNKDPASISREDGLHGDDDKASEELPSKDVQAGVQDIEAITLTWTKKSLFGVFISIWFVYLLNAFQSSTVSGFVPYVTSDFGTHSLLTVIDVVASSMTAAVFIPLAKFLDLCGRAEGFLLMVAFSELGLILMAVSKNLPTYCAANVSNDGANSSQEGM